MWAKTNGALPPVGRAEDGLGADGDAYGLALEAAELSPHLVAAIAGGVSWAVVRTIALRGSRASDLESLALSTMTWAGACAAGLWLLRSDLPQALRRPKRAATASDATKPLADVAQMES